MTQRTDPAAMSGQRRRAGRAEVERDVVGGIPASGLDGIEPAGWSPVRDAVGHVTGPAAFAVLAVVESADESEIANTTRVVPDACLPHLEAAPAGARNTAPRP